MNLLMITLFLMLGLLLSNIFSHYFPDIPAALTQIVFGIIIALASGNYSFEIDAEWFLLLFIAPILYNDGRHFPREELWGMKKEILGNAIILVIVTTICCGYIIDVLIPGIPIAAAFALAAILSPTDPVAINGIAKRVRIPEKIMVLVRGESLINDASGLVAFHYAIAAVITGYFSVREAAGNLFYTFLIGLASGIILMLLINLLQFRLRKSGINDTVFHSLLQILTPFGIYIITEDIFHASGIISVVAAGMVHSFVREHTETILAEEQVLNENIWSLLLFILNGFVFILLGMDIPSAMVNTISSPSIGNVRAFGYIAIIALTLYMIRFIWSYLTTAYPYYIHQKADAQRPELKTLLTTTLTGVRGAVTMAGVLTLPVVLKNGDPFPMRSLIIFISAGVILFSLTMATLFLPLLNKKKSAAPDIEEYIDLSKAKNKLLMAAIQKIKQEITPENESAALELINEYTISFKRNLSRQNPGEEQQAMHNQKVNELRLMALNAQRRYVRTLVLNGEADKVVLDTMEKFLDYREEMLEESLHYGIMHFYHKTLHELKRLRRKYHRCGETEFNKLHCIRDVQIKSMYAAVNELRDYMKTLDHPDYAYSVILDYESKLKRFEQLRGQINEDLEEQKEEQKEVLRLKVLDAERFEIHKMYEAGDISIAQDKELRRFTNHIESIVLYEYNE